jgi:branched-chain amino acid transport system ATP-binding protein
MNLSGGQRKMVAIARGMALAPTLLLLDEAFEGLAPVVVKRFRDAVLKIEDLGISLLIAESNLANAARIADRLYAIDRGEIIFEGKPHLLSRRWPARLRDAPPPLAARDRILR